jgi:hypothetical protein
MSHVSPKVVAAWGRKDTIFLFSESSGFFTLHFTESDEATFWSALYVTELQFPAAAMKSVEKQLY